MQQNGVTWVPRNKLEKEHKKNYTSPETLRKNPQTNPPRFARRGKGAGTESRSRHVAKRNARAGLRDSFKIQ